jgi:hypothetical protein
MKFYGLLSDYRYMIKKEAQKSCLESNSGSLNLNQTHNNLSYHGDPGRSLSNKTYKLTARKESEK